MTNNSIRITYFSLVNFKQVEFNQERAKLEQSTLISVFIPIFVTFSHQKSINSLQLFVISPHYWSIQLICEFTNICVCTSTTKLISKILSASTLAGNKKSLSEKKHTNAYFRFLFWWKLFLRYTHVPAAIYFLIRHPLACNFVSFTSSIVMCHVCERTISYWFQFDFRLKFTVFYNNTEATKIDKVFHFISFLRSNNHLSTKLTFDKFINFRYIMHMMWHIMTVLMQVVTRIRN